MEQIIKQLELLRKSVEMASEKIDTFYESLGKRLDDLERLYQKQLITTDALARSLNESEQNVDDLSQAVNALQEFVDLITTES